MLLIHSIYFSLPASSEGLSEATSALLVELLKPKGVSLGLGLRESVVRGAPLWVSRIKEAGIADRCGALHVGDRLLSVSGVSLENKNIEDVNQMLKKSDLHVQLEIIPGHNYPDEDELLSESLSRLSHHPMSTSQLSGAQSESEKITYSNVTSVKCTLACTLAIVHKYIYILYMYMHVSACTLFVHVWSCG